MRLGLLLLLECETDELFWYFSEIMVEMGQPGIDRGIVYIMRDVFKSRK